MFCLKLGKKERFLSLISSYASKKHFKIYLGQLYYTVGNWSTATIIYLNNYTALNKEVKKIKFDI